MTLADHHFRFDLDGAIRRQLIETLERSPKRSLSRNAGPTESGIYALYWRGQLVYVGKATKAVTKSERDLRTRLNEHVSKLTGRWGITAEEVEFRFLTFESEWWVFAAEYALITHYNPEWNNTGFGSKTPGRGRPGTRDSVWNTRFPPLFTAPPETGPVDEVGP